MIGQIGKAWKAVYAGVVAFLTGVISITAEPMGNERRDGNGRRTIDDLNVRLGDVEEGQSRVFDLLSGPEVEDVDGTMKRQTEEGMEHKVDWMYEQERNGGLRVRLGGRDLAVLVAAFLMSAGGIIAALVS